MSKKNQKLTKTKLNSKVEKMQEDSIKPKVLFSSSSTMKVKKPILERDPTNCSSKLAMSTNTSEIMELIEEQRVLEKKMLALKKISNLEHGDIKKAYGVTTRGNLYKCLASSAGTMIKGTFRLIYGKCLSEIATEATGEKNGRKWSSMRNNKTGDFVRGTFKWITDLIEESDEEPC